MPGAGGGGAMLEEGAQGDVFAIWAGAGCRVLHRETGCKRGFELPGSIVRTTSRWMLGWQLVAEPRGRLCFWLAQGAGGSPQFLRSIALRLPWPKRPGDNGRGDPVGGVPHISKSYLNQIQTIFKIHLKIHGVLKENYFFHRLHNTYRPLGAMGEKM